MPNARQAKVHHRTACYTPVLLAVQCVSACIVCVPGMTVSRQSQVMAQVTFQALFRSFPKLCGMTGTAATDADELGETYGLDVVQVRWSIVATWAVPCSSCW